MAAAEATADIIVLVQGTWRFWVWGNMVFGMVGKLGSLRGFGICDWFLTDL